MHIQTPRLTLDPATTADTPALYDHWREPDVNRAVWSGRVTTPADADRLIARSMTLQQTDGTGIWAARLSDTATFVGACGYWRFWPGAPLELFYSLNPAYRGQGLAIEIAQAMIAHGFERLHLPEVLASTEDTNATSRHILEKVGMRYQDAYAWMGVTYVYYGLQAP